MNESRTLALRINSLKINHEFRGIVLGVSKYFGAVERDDMIRDDLYALRSEVGIIDA